MNRSSGGGPQPGHAAMTKLSSLLQRRLAASEQLAGDDRGHPDADLLSAFAERSLSPKEREPVVAHLAACSECREILALSSAMQPIDTAAAHARETRAAGWWAWRLAAVAALAVIIATLWLPLPHTKPGRRVTSVQPAAHDVPAPSGRVPDAASAVQPVAVSPIGEPQKSYATVEKQAPRRARISVSVAKTLVAPPPERTVNPPEKIYSSANLALPSNTYVAPLFPKAVIPSSPASQMPVSAAAPTTQLTATAGAAQAERKKKSAEVSVEAKITLDQRQKASFVPRDENAVLGSSLYTLRRLPAAAAKPESASANTRAESLMHKQDLWMLPSRANAGVVEKSEDGGKTWRTIPVDQTTDFNALSSAGQDVWVGGANGKLFESSDSGAHWAAVPVSDGPAQLDEVISSIDVQGSSVTLKTASGASWTSADSGAHWHHQR